MPREQSKCRAWEKERRNRLNEAFSIVHKLLPSYEPSKNPSKVEILKNTASYIEELQTKILSLSETSTNEAVKSVKTGEYKKLQERIKRLLNKNEQLCTLLREAKITIPKGCFLTRKFNYPNFWSNRILPEHAKIIQKKEAEKENDASAKKTPRKFPVKKATKSAGPNSTPKHRKAILNRSDVKKVRNNKKKKPKPLIPSKCVLVLSQPSITPPCYVITNASSNSILGGTSTVITNSGLITNPLVSTKTAKTVASIPPLGPGTLILANGTIVPVVPQPTVVPQIITRPPIILLKNPINVPATTVGTQPKVSTPGAKTLARIRPKYCFTKTTQVNKVPIPALTSRYSNVEVVLKKSEPKEKKTVPKESEKKQEIVEPKRKTEPPEEGSEVKKTKVVEEKEVEKVVEISEKTTDKIGRETPREEEKTEESKKPEESLDLNLNHSELSNDIFASLQVPPGCQNPESTSPTAAFLLAFPLVSTLTGVKVTEVTEEDNTESQRGTPTLLQIGTMDSTKPTQSESLTPSLLNLDNLSFFSSKDIGGFYNSFEGTNVKNSTDRKEAEYQQRGARTQQQAHQQQPQQSVQPQQQSQQTLQQPQQARQQQQALQQQQHPSQVLQKQQPQQTLQQQQPQQVQQQSQQGLQQALPQQKPQQVLQQQPQQALQQQKPQQSLQKQQPQQVLQQQQQSQQALLKQQPQQMLKQQQQSQQAVSQQPQQAIPQQPQQALQQQPIQQSQKPLQQQSQQPLQQQQPLPQPLQQQQSQPPLQQSQKPLQQQSQQTLQQQQPLPQPLQQQQSQQPLTQPLQHRQTRQQLQPQKALQQTQQQRQEKNQLVPCFDNHPIPTFGTNDSTNSMSYHSKSNVGTVDNKQHTYNPKNFTSFTTTCSYPNSIKSYPEPLYTNSSTYTYSNTSDSNLNQNYYKDISKSDNRNYYSLNYENYADYRKNDSNSYFPGSNYYQNSKCNTNSTQKAKNGTSQSRPPINWMTTPDNRLQTPSDYALPQFTKEPEFYPTNTFINTQTTYFNTNPMYTNTNDTTTNQERRKSLDLSLVPSNSYQRNEVEENQFSWSPTKIPQFLDPPHSFVSSTLPTLVGDLALGNPPSFSEQKTEKCQKKDNNRRIKNYEGNQSFLSVSQLVDHNKEAVPARTTTRRNSGNRSGSGKKVPPKAQRKDSKEVSYQNTKVDSSGKGIKQIGYSGGTSEVFCDSNQKNRNVKNSYSAEALIGHQMQNDQKRQQNYNNKPISVSSFLHDNIIPYFPAVDLPTQDNSYIQQNQNYQASSFSHNFPTNNTYTANTFIPTTTITSSYNFMHDVPPHDYSDLFPPMNKEKACSKGVAKQQCPPTPKKSKRKHSNDLPGFVDFPFLSMPGSINSPILPDDFHTHTTFLQPPTYPCKNPFTKPNDLGSSSLLPLPPVPGPRSNIQHPEISPSINSVGTSLTNFNLSTIFPEINNKGGLDAYSVKENRSYTTTQVSFNDKPTFSFSYINTSQSYNNQ